MKDKVVFLRTLPETEQGKNDVLDYKTLLLGQINNPPRPGLNKAQMIERLRILNALKNVEKDVWIVPYRTWQGLLAEFREIKWTLVSQNIITFLDDLADAQDFDANEMLEENPAGLDLTAVGV